MAAQVPAYLGPRPAAKRNYEKAAAGSQATSQTGEFSGVYQLKLSYEQDLSGWSGQQTLTLDVAAEVVLEPNTLALLSAAALTLIGYGWRQRSARPTKPAAIDQQVASAILPFPWHSSAVVAARRTA